MLRHWFLGSLMTSCCLVSILWSAPVGACGLGDAIQNRRSLPDWDRATYPTAELLQKMNEIWEGEKQAIASPASRFNLSQVSWASQEILPPGIRHDATRRCGGAPYAGYPLIALVPEQAYGQTISATPKLFIYVPPTLGLRAEFRLTNTEEQTEVVKEFTLPEGSGIIAITLETPDHSFSLETGKLYEWDFVIPVDPLDPSGDAFLHGSIERVAPDPTLTAALAHSSTLDRQAYLAEAGLWYDTLASLYALRQTNSTNAAYVSQLQQVLESVDLGYLSDKPIVAEF
ncbi:MAG: DUF928 domain-containing protein [Oculatellaceae cyanobacterium bins.114]|nr:DUF928 domain-containing protein [Oculatellaceae cyanobacterium bins.114]